MKNKILIIVISLYVIIFAVVSIILPDQKISFKERRKLNVFPTYKLDSSWINDLEKYLLDHFFLKDEFRSIKSYYNYNIVNQFSNNDIYIDNNNIYKSEYPTNKKSIENFKNKINSIASLFENSNKYLMIIPDKNYYYQNKDFLNIDYGYLYNEMFKMNYKKIDLRNVLNNHDYYETDTHWKQENLIKVIIEMQKALGYDYYNIDYKYQSYDKFYGVYYGQSSIYRKPEKLTYLTTPLFDNIKVKYLENKNLSYIYNKDNLYTFDSYEIFLDGASSFIEIENNNVKYGKELIIFRDSFASSLVPLLVNYYKKIIVIDNRYITSNKFMPLLSYNSNTDVLFMYSTLSVNNSFILKG